VAGHVKVAAHTLADSWRLHTCPARSIRWAACAKSRRKQKQMQRRAKGLGQMTMRTFRP